MFLILKNYIIAHNNENYLKNMDKDGKLYI